jgi:hypothetical protein
MLALLGCYRFQLGARPTGKHEVHAPPSECGCDMRSDAPRGSGDECCLSCSSRPSP